MTTNQERKVPILTKVYAIHGLLRMVDYNELDQARATFEAKMQIAPDYNVLNHLALLRCFHRAARINDLEEQLWLCHIWDAQNE